jgi:hypothetical protein
MATASRAVNTTEKTTARGRKSMPFSRFDLVSCRNLPICFGLDVQNQVIPIFHYALKPDGYLWRLLIARALAYTLRAKTQPVFGADGVFCRREMPLISAASRNPVEQA